MDTLMTGATQIFRHIQQNATLLQDAQFMEQGQGPLICCLKVLTLLGLEWRVYKLCLISGGWNRGVPQVRTFCPYSGAISGGHLDIKGSTVYRGVFTSRGLKHKGSNVHIDVFISVGFFWIILQLNQVSNRL